MKVMLSLRSTLLLTSILWAAAHADERKVKIVQFPSGKSATTINGNIVGRNYIDYQLRAGAGQLLMLQLAGSHGASYFNLLPPDSDGAAMGIGELSDNRFWGFLPDDGVYTIRVFLMRSAAQRNETSSFQLSIAISGKPLAALASSADARVPGTRFHATTDAPCAPAYTQPTQCRLGVIRRGNVGTATIELQWAQSDGRLGKRRILFVNNAPKSSDTAQVMTSTQNVQGWQINFGGNEYFEIPEALINGG